MFRSASTGFGRYDVTEQTAQTARKWDDSHMYRTSYFNMSEKNVYIKSITVIEL